MCGIAGYIQKSEKDETALEQMLERIRHRGPDGTGKWHSCGDQWSVSLGHTRLAIIDLDGGTQPMAALDHEARITFNGEIYNFRELRQELEVLGTRFHTRSDTEVLLNHYLSNGVDGLSRLNGMFAFAIWDGARKTMILARDRSGIKPLYYAKLQDGGIVFCSELSALLAHPGVSRKVSPDGLSSYFFSDYIFPPETAITGVYKLEPGHFLLWKDGQTSNPEPYWSPSGERAEVPDASSEDALASELWERLGLAVKRQSVSDVPIGVFLSGGIDSSSVAALAQSQSRNPIRTFSIGFDDPTFDESTYARLVARHIRSEHTEEILSEGEFIDVAAMALNTLDEPMADPSLIPTYLLSRITAKSVKVALGGDGGDELWAGYPTYKAYKFASLYEWAPAWVRNNVLPWIVSQMPVDDRYQSLEWKLKRFINRWDENPVQRHLRWMSNIDLKELCLAIRASAGQPRVLSQETAFDRTAPINSLLALDFKTYLPGSVLTKVDRASMAHGLEVRPPFLDNDLIDWVFRLPEGLKLKGLTGKYLLKKAAIKHLPPEIVTRPKKGFGIPVAKWLRGPLKPLLERAMSDSPLWSDGKKNSILDREVFLRWVSEHQQCRVDRSKPLWALLVLNAWLEKEGLHASL